MNILIGADHRGFSYKEYIKNNLTMQDITWIDVGAYNDERSDYPLFAQAACKRIQNNEAQLAILLCGSGIGMAITANRFTSIYAGVAWNEKVARESREDDNVNVLVLPVDFITQEESVRIIQAWLHAKFKGGRYQDRIKQIDTSGI
jgi:ribose 5-phosphate isomerase B